MIAFKIVPMPGFCSKKIHRKITNKLIKKVITPIDRSICNDMPCANTLHGEAPVSDTSNSPSPKPNKVNPKQRNKKVDIFGLKFKGFFELQETLGIFLIERNIFYYYYNSSNFSIYNFMKKYIYILFLFFLASYAQAHTKHYKGLIKLELEVLRNDETIGYSNYFFEHDKNIMTVKNYTQFKVKLFGATIFSISSEGIEKYENDKLIYFKSTTFQNDKEKYVNLKYDEKINKLIINGSSYKGKANLDCVIGNWWNHKILEANRQISPLSGSLKDQVVKFIGYENITLYGKNFSAARYKLKSKDDNLPDDKKLDFDIWLDRKNNLILKVTYKRMGDWEYRLKSYQ